MQIELFPESKKTKAKPAEQPKTPRPLTIGWYNLKGYDCGVEKPLARKLARQCVKKHGSALTVPEFAQLMIDLALEQKLVYNIRVLAWATDREVHQSLNKRTPN